MRPHRLRGIETWGDATFRVWEMTTSTDVDVPTPLLGAAREKATWFASNQSHSGTGFVILHKARPACFALIHLWDGVDLLQQYWTSAHESPGRLMPHRQEAIGCVWEIEIISAEQKRWRATLTA